MQEAGDRSSDQPGVFVQSVYHSETVYDIQTGIHLLESQLGQCIAQQHQLQLIISRGMLFVEELKSALTVAVKFSPRSSNQLFEEIRYRLDGHSLVEIMNQPPSGNQKQRRVGRTGSKMSTDASGSPQILPRNRSKKAFKSTVIQTECISITILFKNDRRLSRAH